MAKRECGNCGEELTGQGSNNARLCVECWTGILLRVEQGERRSTLAQEFGVSRQAVELKWALYGGDDR